MTADMAAQLKPSEAGVVHTEAPGTDSDEASNRGLNGLRERFIMRLIGGGTVVALLTALLSTRARTPLPQAPAVHKLATT